MVPRDGMRMGFVIQEITYLPQKVGEVIYLYEPSLIEKLEYERHSLCSCLVKIPDQTGNVDVVIRCLFPCPSPPPRFLFCMYPLSVHFVLMECPVLYPGIGFLLTSKAMPSVVSWRLPLSSIWKFGASFDLVWTIDLTRDWWMGIGKAVECPSGGNFYF